MQTVSWTSLLSGLALAVAGCSGSSSDDGDLSRPVLGAVHAVADMGSITFLRVEENWADLEYGQGTAFRSVDADHYNFNFDTLLPDDDADICIGDLHGTGINRCTRLATVPLEVRNGFEYTVILAGRFGDIDVLVDEKPFHQFDDGDLHMELQVFNLASQFDEFDIYLEPPGTHLSPAQARGTLSRLESFHGLMRDGTYVLTLSAVADPSIAYFTSEAFALDRRTRVILAIRDGMGENTSEIAVNLLRDRTGTLLDRHREAALRVAHAAAPIGPADIYALADFSQPLVANLAPGEVSSYVSMPRTDLQNIDLDVTPAANPGVFLARERFDLAIGERATFFVLGTQERLGGLKVGDGVRRLATHALVRAVSGAHTAFDLYVVPEGSSIALSAPNASLSFEDSVGPGRVPPGRYDIALTPRNSNHIAFGPISVELAAGGFYTIVVTDTGEATSAGVLLLDDFQH